MRKEIESENVCTTERDLFKEQYDINEPNRRLKRNEINFVKLPQKNVRTYNNKPNEHSRLTKVKYEEPFLIFTFLLLVTPFICILSHQ